MGRIPSGAAFHPGRSRLLAAIGCVALLIGSVHPAAAGTIRLSVQLTASLSGGDLDLDLTIGNTGDEPAFNLVSTVEFEGARTVVPVGDVMEPSRTIGTAATLPANQLTASSGTWPVIVRVSYTDANNHPFEALHVGIVRSGAPDDTRPLDLRLSDSVVSTSGTITATVRSEIEESIELMFVAPSHVELRPSRATVRLQPSAASEVRVEATNDGATPGSRLPVFAIARYTRPAGHQRTTVAGAMITIDPAPQGPDTAKALALLLGALVTTWVLILVRAARRNRSRHAS